ncbi:MAG: AraC family transcriptional regulator [Clostridiales bacterium]|nr:AraC family transcriptional regulator [Clostridiales bacterium]
MEQTTKDKKFYKHKISNFLNVQKIVTVHYQEPEKDYVSQEETHDFWEIIYADKKDVFVVKNGVKHLLKQGEVIFISPNQPHHVECLGEEANIFILSFECRSASITFFHDKKYRVPDEYRYLLQNIMTEATETFVLPDFDPDLHKLILRDNPNLGGEQVLKNQLELLLIYLLRAANNQSAQQEFFLSKISSSNDLQDEIVCFLASKIYDTLSLDELCEKLHYGKTHLCSFFKQKTGNSIYRTYLKLKIDEAKKLIRRKHSFTDVTNKLYFDSVAHFSYVFKKYTGMTPKEYKSSIK